MNLNVLSNPTMAVVSGEWLGNPAITADIVKVPLGACVLKEVEKAHELVLRQRSRRMAVRARKAEINRQVGELVAVRNSMARALFSLLTTLAEVVEDPDLAEFLRQQRTLLFPDGLVVLRMSHLDAAGTVIEVEARMTPAMEQKLGAVNAGDRTLGDIYRAWVDAGKRLGRLVQERARIDASLRRSGTTAPQTHARKVRAEWIRAVRLLLDALGFLSLPDATREALLAPLRHSIRDAVVARARARTGAPDDGTGPDNDMGPNTEPGDDMGPNTEPGDGAGPLGGAVPTREPDRTRGPGDDVPDRPEIFAGDPGGAAAGTAAGESPGSGSESAATPVSAGVLHPAHVQPEAWPDVFAVPPNGS